VAHFDLNPVVTQDLVDAYRRELEEVWSIRPAAWGEEIDSRLEPRERKDWHAFMRKLGGDDRRAVVRFYDWLSTRRRVGAIHSSKWAEILVSGVWAAAVVNALAPERILDLGCNVGYWTTWMAQERVVFGVDRARPAISLARVVTGELGRGAEFIEKDFSAGEVARSGLTASSRSRVSCTSSTAAITLPFRARPPSCGQAVTWRSLRAASPIRTTPALSMPHFTRLDYRSSRHRFVVASASPSGCGATSAPSRSRTARATGHSQAV